VSYHNSNAIQPTPGLSYEAHQAGVPSPMFPFAPYRPAAAGPRTLTHGGLSGSPITQWGAPPTVPSNLRGLGIDPTSLVSQYVEPYLDKTVQGVINRNWPVLEQKLNESTAPLKLLLGMTVVASGVAAVVGYLNYRKG
jgi:hypothetical protein